MKRGRNRGQIFNPLISSTMNKFIYPLAAAAALFTGNLFAQEAALSSAENNTTSMYDCVKTVSDANRTLDFEGGVITQEFTACTTGQLSGKAALFFWEALATLVMVGEPFTIGSRSMRPSTRNSLHL